MTNDDGDHEEASAADRAEMLIRLEREVASGEVIREVAKAARKRVTRLRRAGIPVARGTAEDLAHDALLLTIEGRRPWDGTYPLAAHLNAIVRSLASDMLRSQQKRRHVALLSEPLWSESGDQGGARAADLARRGPKVGERANRLVSVHDAAARLLGAIRETLGHDEATMRVAAAWERGDTGRAEAIEASGLTPAAYDAAVKRIRRAIDALPDDLRSGSEDAMEVSHGA